MLALAAFHGHPEQPPASHAQPEEQGLQLGGARSQTPLWGRAAEHESASWPSVCGRGTPPGTGITVGNVHFLHLLYFCRSQLALCTVTLLGETRDRSLFQHFLKHLSQMKVKKWRKMPPICFWFTCCIVKSSHASLIAFHWQTPYSAFKFLVPSLSWLFFFSPPSQRKPTGVSYFGS